MGDLTGGPGASPILPWHLEALPCNTLCVVNTSSKFPPQALVSAKLKLHEDHHTTHLALCALAPGFVCLSTWFVLRDGKQHPMPHSRCLRVEPDYIVGNLGDSRVKGRQACPQGGDCPVST